jgi:hypothetical protein
VTEFSRFQLQPHNHFPITIAAAVRKALPVRQALRKSLAQSRKDCRLAQVEGMAEGTPQPARPGGEANCSSNSQHCQGRG